ncbi:hypothetical protein [Lactobacillus brevis] [Lactiplantibacillus mudanjiangensis]|uniref:hypothetical protein n=1 Tax=Lactiplantibacillus mudanjiangensis TaxID=1296538 RepID=UPI0010156D6F|nr:hypothetical protein [Lactobacillus brevis] [Lactiplantibacillus mudanjiangensis]
MLKQSDAFNQAFASDNRTLTARLTVGDRSFTTDDLTSITYDSAAMTGEQMGIGSTYENSVKIAFADLVENIKPQDKVTVEIGIMLPDKTFEYAPMGVFYVDGEITMDRNNNLTSITAVDAMSWLEGTYTPKVTLPTKLSAMALDIANQAGVTIDQDSFSKLPNIAISSLPQNQTYRTVIGWLSALLPGYATFNRSGQLALRGLNNAAYTVNTANYEFQGLVKNENAYTVSGITVSKVTETSDYSATAANTNTDTPNENDDGAVTSGDDTDTALQIGSTTGSQLALQNNFITDRILKDIWGQIEEIQYCPYTLNWFGNPAVEAGDWLTVFDTKGNQFIVPNNSYTLTFEGGLSATSSTGETVTSPTSWDYHSPLAQTIKEINKRLNATGTYTYYTPTQPADPHEGDLWYKTAGDSTELYIYSNLKWILMVSDVTGKQISDKVDAAQVDIVNARKVADTANALAGTKVGVTDYNTKITQLTNDINLRVTKGDVISQINMEAGQTLIQSGKILLDAPSVIFSGSAFIPDAAIKALSASKLTAGTLDANVINVINMNANNITAGILSGKNLSLNLETGAVNFQSGHISGPNDYFDIDIDKGIITSSDSGFHTMIFKSGSIDYKESSTDTALTAQIGLNWGTLFGLLPAAVIQAKNALMLSVSDPLNTSFSAKQNGAIDIRNSSVSIYGGKLRDKSTEFGTQYTGSSMAVMPSFITADAYSNNTLGAGTITLSSYDTGDVLKSYVKVSNSGVDIFGDTDIHGKFYINYNASKNALQLTRDGLRATPAYETAESYLGDIGEDITDGSGSVTIQIEMLFGDTINTAIPYQVFLQSYSKARVWVSSRNEAFFIVKSSEPNTSFCWELKGKRRGFENERLVRHKTTYAEIEKMEEQYNERK